MALEAQPDWDGKGTALRMASDNRTHWPLDGTVGRRRGAGAAVVEDDDLRPAVGLEAVLGNTPDWYDRIVVNRGVVRFH